MIRSIFFFLLCMAVPFVLPAQPEGGAMVIEDFEVGHGEFLKAWPARDATAAEVARVYTIRKESGNAFLHAETRGDSIQIGKIVSWNLRSYPVLTWKWRAWKLPAGGNETEKRKNDSAAALYVIFPRAHIPLVSWKYQPINVIKYVWSTTLPPGRMVKKNKEKMGAVIFEGNFLVIRGGNAGLGTWITERRNVLADYRRLFGESPRYRPMMIGLLTDSNNTKSSAAADYDDIVIRKE